MVRYICFILSLLISSSACLAQIKDTLKVGAILPLTGPLASIGEAMRQGINLAALESVNIKFEIDYEDDLTANRVKAVSAAKKLIDLNKVDVVLNAYASTVSAISPALKQSNTPCIVIWDSNSALTTLGNHVVGFGYSNELAGEDMAEFAFKQRKKETVAVIAFHDEWSEVIANAFVERFKKIGGEVVLNERVNSDTTDFKSLIARIKARNAGAIYLPLYGAGLSTAIKQARSLNYEGDLLTADSFGDYELKETGRAAEGLYATQIWLDNDDFKKKYEAKFSSGNSAGVNLGYVALAYDTLKLLDALSGKLLKSNEKISATTIINSFAGFEFEGILGHTHISSKRMTDRREKVLKVQDGKFIVASAHQ